MNCAEFEVRLADYLDQTLSPADSVALENHAALCSDCRRLLEDAGAGLRVLQQAVEVHTPPDLLTRIAYEAPVGRLRDPWESDGFLSRMLRPVLQPFLQPRIAMGMAMTILSFAMLERCTGIHVQHMQAADLNPVRIWGGVEDRAFRLKDRAEKYYENLRWVYEIEVELGTFRQQAEAANRKQAAAAATSQASKDGKK